MEKIYKILSLPQELSLIKKDDLVKIIFSMELITLFYKNELLYSQHWS